MDYYAIWLLVVLAILLIKLGLGVCLWIHRREKMRQIRERRLNSPHNHHHHHHTHSQYQQYRQTPEVYVVPGQTQDLQPQYQHQWTPQEAQFPNQQGWTSPPSAPTNWNPYNDMPPSYNEATYDNQVKSDDPKYFR